MCSVIWWDSRILPFLLKLLDNFTLTRTRAFYYGGSCFFKVEEKSILRIDNLKSDGK